MQTAACVQILHPVCCFLLPVVCTYLCRLVCCLSADCGEPAQHHAGLCFKPDGSPTGTWLHLRHCVPLVLFRLHRGMHRALSLLPRNKKNMRTSHFMLHFKNRCHTELISFPATMQFSLPVCCKDGALCVVELQKRLVTDLWMCQ